MAKKTNRTAGDGGMKQNPYKIVNHYRPGDEYYGDDPGPVYKSQPRSDKRPLHNKGYAGEGPLVPPIGQRKQQGVKANSAAIRQAIGESVKGGEEPLRRRIRSKKKY